MLESVSYSSGSIWFEWSLQKPINEPFQAIDWAVYLLLY